MSEPIRAYLRPGIYHTNQVSWGPCHYFTLRSGRRVIFRANELEAIAPTPFIGGVVKSKGGCLFDTTSPVPDVIVR